MDWHTDRQHVVKRPERKDVKLYRNYMPGGEYLTGDVISHSNG